MTRRMFARKSVIGWVADSSLPRFGRLLVEPGSGQVSAIDVTRQHVVPLAGGPVRRVHGPAGSHVFDAVRHPDHGLFIAFGRSRGHGAWALLRVREDGSVQDVGAPAGLATMSLCCAGDGDLVLGVASTEVAGGRQVGGGIALFSPVEGTFRWLYRPPAGEHFVPSGVCWDAGAILFVHTSRHVLFRLSGDGRLDGVTGRLGHPDADLYSLNTPTGVSAAGGHYVVTDSGNHRILLIDRDGHVIGSSAGAVGLTDPRHALTTGDQVFVADLGSRSVLALDPDLRAVRGRWGGPEASGLLLSRPRSIDRAATGELVIADTNNDRIVGVDDHGVVRWQISEVTAADGRSEELRWPRSARISAGGRLVVSDSLNSRFLVVGRSGAVEHEFSRVVLGGDPYPVSDPHDGRWIGENELLVVDSASGWVARVRCNGVAGWVVTGLRDPHQAALFGERVIVVDPELDAVILVDAASGAEVWRRNEFADPAGGRYRLSKPRAIHAAADCVLIADEHSQVVALGADWSVRWAWNGKLARAPGPGVDLEVPEAPRDLLLGDLGGLFLSDYRRNCVLELKAV